MTEIVYAVMIDGILYPYVFATRQLAEQSVEVTYANINPRPTGIKVLELAVLKRAEHL